MYIYWIRIHVGRIRISRKSRAAATTIMFNYTPSLYRVIFLYSLPPPRSSHLSDPLRDALKNSLSLTLSPRRSIIPTAHFLISPRFLITTCDLRVLCVGNPRKFTGKNGGESLLPRLRLYMYIKRIIALSVHYQLRRNIVIFNSSRKYINVFLQQVWLKKRAQIFRKHRSY